MYLNPDFIALLQTTSTSLTASATAPTSSMTTSAWTGCRLKPRYECLSTAVLAAAQQALLGNGDCIGRLRLG